MSSTIGVNLNVDLKRGVVPISKAASSLAALIKRAGATQRPIIVTQKGYPTGVILPVEVFMALKQMAEGDTDYEEPSVAEDAANGDETEDESA